MDKFKNKFKKDLNEYSKVKKVIAVVSGKGGVGKSMVTSSLAVISQRNGYNTAILDADITGPSIPQSFNVQKHTFATKRGIQPAISKSGIQIMSLNLLVENPGDPVVWRGSILADMVTQFWSDVYWNDVDFMFVDCPPGTSDVPLTVYQSLPIDGIIIVTTPQDLVTMIVEKAVKMANTMDIPILGIVENMSYFTCPTCNDKHYIFGKSKIEEIAKKFNIDTYVKLPINPTISNAIDNGKVETLPLELDHIFNKIKNV